MKNINDIINNYNFQKRMSEKKYNYLIEQTQRLKNIFNKETVDEINKEIKYFKRIYDYLPRPINKYIQGHLVKRLDHYLHYRENENIPKTSNNAENYFQTCDSNCMKKVYRTPEGAELFIRHKMIYWNVKLFKSYNRGYIERFTKKSGGMDNFYKNVNKMLIKRANSNH